jgi:Na+-transporting methylmalonyl-CoA/oxaloacetate decarboxylase gamma subunit
MNAALSLLGTAMLILIGLAVVLAVIIVIFYEARWIVRLGRQLLRSTAAADGTGTGSEPFQDERGGA